MNIKLFCFSMMGIIACVCFLAHQATNVQAAAQDEIVVYRVAGYDVSTWTDVEDRAVKTNLILNNVDLVNPKIKGDHVYIPEEQTKGNGAYHFYFLDQLEEYKGAIYRLNREATLWDDNGSKEPTKELFNLGKEGDLIFDTFLDKTGMDRVYLDNPATSIEKRRFYYRECVTLVRPAIK